MKKLLFLVFTVSFCFNIAFAQETKRTYTGPTQNPKANVKKTATATPAKPTNSTQTANLATRRRGEFYVGYTASSMPTNTGGGFVGNQKQLHQGVQTSLTLNASRFIGLKGDFSMTYRDQREAFTTGGPITTTVRRTTITNILGGVQLKDNDSDAFVQPFGHALVGAGLYRQKFTECNNAVGGFCGTLVKGSGLAGAFGGGLDFNFTNRAGIRLVSDYNPMRIENETINNFRFGVGVVFK